MSKNNKKLLTKKELIAMLKAIASDKTPRVEHHGAMCYVPRTPLKFICDACGQESFSERYDDDYTIIMGIIKEMTELGFDVKVEKVCDSCAEKIKKELEADGIPTWIRKINYIFFFRNPKDTEYHRAVVHGFYSYNELLTMMKNGECTSEGLVEAVISLWGTSLSEL